MALAQSVEGCLEATIGALGLPQTSLDANLAKLEPRLASLREAYAKSTLPLLRVPEWREDIVEAQAALKLLTHGARSVLRAASVARRAGRNVDRLRRWALEVQARTNHNKATCALANKLARIAWAVWVKHERYQAAA